MDVGGLFRLASSWQQEQYRAIQEEMFSVQHRFILMSRFTPDCLENTFSCVRVRNLVPTPLEFHHALRIISVGPFLTDIQIQTIKIEEEEEKPTQLDIRWLAQGIE